MFNLPLASSITTCKQYLSTCTASSASSVHPSSASSVHAVVQRVGQEKLTNEVAKDSDIQFIRAEIERQKKSELDKEADSESSRADIQVLRADIQSLRAELDNQKKIYSKRNQLSNLSGLKCKY
ncbi:hypothetical protein ACLKA6_019015 [Drosophila palustris]